MFVVLMKYEKSTVIIIVLSALLVIAAGFIASEQLQKARAAQLLNVSQQAYYAGVYDTVSSLYRETENCNVATVNLINLTRQLVDVSCLKQEKK